MKKAQKDSFSEKTNIEEMTISEFKLGELDNSNQESKSKIQINDFLQKLHKGPRGFNGNLENL